MTSGSKIDHIEYGNIKIVVTKCSKFHWNEIRKLTVKKINFNVQAIKQFTCGSY